MQRGVTTRSFQYSQAFSTLADSAKPKNSSHRGDGDDDGGYQISLLRGLGKGYFRGHVTLIDKDILVSVDVIR